MAISTDKQQNEITFPGTREVLTSGRTFYVRTDGSDSNSGLADSPGGAFLTIQKAVDTVADTLDLNGFTCTINVGDGTYAGIVQLKQCVGDTSTSYINLTGNTGTPANVVVSGGFQSFNCTSYWNISGFSSSATRLYSARHTRNTRVSSLTWGGVFGGAIVFAEQGSYIEIDTGVITHNGSGPSGPALQAIESSSIVRVNNPTIDFANAITVNDGVVQADKHCHIALQGVGFLNGGNVTGARFTCTNSSTITTGSDSFTAIPGTTDGILDSSSSYDGHSQIENTSGVPSAPTNPIQGLYQYDDATGIIYVYDGTTWQTYSPDSGRTVLTGHTTYYVRTDGSDSNTGLVDSSGGAFLTIQKGLDVIGFEIDCAGYEVTLQVRDGTYAETPEIRELVGGDNDGADPNLYVRGNVSTPSNVIVNGFTIEGVGSTTRVEFEGFQLQSASRLVEAQDASNVRIGNMVFNNASAVAGLWAVRSCLFSKAGATWTFNADVGQMLYALDQSKIVCDNAVTIDAAVAITPSSTVQCIERSYMDLSGVTWANSGNVTGQRFNITEFSQIYTGDTAPLTYIPGTTTGTQDDTSRIDDYFKFGATTGAPAATGASAGHVQHDSAASTLYIFDGTTWDAFTPTAGGSGRTLLTANTTYYVRTDGSDSNTGLVDSSGGAFLTIGKAVEVVTKDIDLQGYSVTIQVRDGTYSEVLNLGPCVGFAGDVNQAVTLQGNFGTPGNVVAGVINVGACGNTSWTIAAMDVTRLDFEGNGEHGATFIEYSGSSGQIALRVRNGARVVCDGGASTITGNYGTFIEVSDGYLSGEEDFDFNTSVTIGVVVRAFDQSYVDLSDASWTNGGNVTGQRFEVRESAHLHASSTDNLTAIPGTTAGELDKTAWYSQYSLGTGINVETITAAKTLVSNIDCRTQILTNTTSSLDVNLPTTQIEQDEYFVVNPSASTQNLVLKDVAATVATITPGNSYQTVWDGSNWH